jgi:hypothetical protein
MSAQNLSRAAPQAGTIFDIRSNLSFLMVLSRIKPIDMPFRGVLE